MYTFDEGRSGLVWCPGYIQEDFLAAEPGACHESFVPVLELPNEEYSSTEHRSTRCKPSPVNPRRLPLPDFSLSG